MVEWDKSLEREQREGSREGRGDQNRHDIFVIRYGVFLGEAGFVADHVISRLIRHLLLCLHCKWEKKRGANQVFYFSEIKLKRAVKLC